MYSQTFSYTPFRHCSVVPLPPNHSTAIKPPTHIKRRVAYEKRQGSSSSIVAKGGLKHLFDVGENEGNEEGPIELPQDFNPFEVPEATPLQTAASCLLTGSIAFLLYRSFKRRAKRAKEKRFRSSGVEDVRKEAKVEALKALEKANSLAEELKPNRPPASAVQALIGAIMAGAIAYVLYNFAVTVESSLDKQFVSSNYQGNLRKRNDIGCYATASKARAKESEVRLMQAYGEMQYVEACYHAHAHGSRGIVGTKILE